MDKEQEELAEIDRLNKQLGKLRSKALDRRIQRLGLYVLKDSCYLSDGESEDSDHSDSTGGVVFGPSPIPDHFRRVYISVSIPEINEKQWYIAVVSGARKEKKKKRNKIFEPLFSFLTSPANPGSATAFLGTVAYTIAGSSTKYLSSDSLTGTVGCFDTGSLGTTTNTVMMPELKRPRSGAVAVGYKDILYIFGGIHANSDAPKALRKTDMVYWTEVLDPKRQRYITVSVPPGSLADIDGNFTAVALEEMGKILLIGVASGKLHRLYYYVPEFDYWETAPVVIPRVDDRLLSAAAVPHVIGRGRGGGRGRRRSRISIQSDSYGPKIKISNIVRCGHMVCWYYLGLYVYDLMEGLVASAQIQGLEDAGLVVSGDHDFSHSEQVENFLVSLMGVTTWRNPMVLSLVTLQANMVQFTKFIVRKNEDNTIEAYYVDEETFMLDRCSKIMSVNAEGWKEPPSDQKEDQEGQTSKEPKDVISHDQEPYKSLEETKQVVGSHDDLVSVMNIDVANLDKEIPGVSRKSPIDSNVAAVEEAKEDQIVPEVSKERSSSGSSSDLMERCYDLNEGVVSEVTKDTKKIICQRGSVQHDQHA